MLGPRVTRGQVSPQDIWLPAIPLHPGELNPPTPTGNRREGSLKTMKRSFNGLMEMKRSFIGGSLRGVGASRGFPYQRIPVHSSAYQRVSIGIWDSARLPARSPAIQLPGAAKSRSQDLFFGSQSLQERSKRLSRGFPGTVNVDVAIRTRLGLVFIPKGCPWDLKIQRIKLAPN